MPDLDYAEDAAPAEITAVLHEHIARIDPETRRPRRRVPARDGARVRPAIDPRTFPGPRAGALTLPAWNARPCTAPCVTPAPGSTWQPRRFPSARAQPTGTRRGTSPRWEAAHDRDQQRPPRPSPSACTTPSGRSASPTGSCDYWVRLGLLKPLHLGGSGNSREWTRAELDVARMMGRLVAAGLKPEPASRVARSPGRRCEIADGIWIEVTA